MRIRIRGGRVIDPGHLDGIFDIVVDDGVIVDIRAPKDKFQENDPKALSMPVATPGETSEQIINVDGKMVVPGLIDMHVHLREPGHEHKETIQSGCKAAVAGGFTAICAMPNTKPVNDNARVTQYIIEKAHLAESCRVFPVGAISRGLQGQVLSEFGELKSAGVIAVTDDGMPVADSQMMRRALKSAKDFEIPVISHCEDPALTAHGVMNEGPTAKRLGFAGIPNASESVMVMRDIALSELTGHPVHIAHVSTAESVRAIRDAKKRGVCVTAETAPHYFSLTDEAVATCNTHAKMNPPLRSLTDSEAVCEGLIDGTIDAIATDHAPHSRFEKDVEFEKAANGIIGLETAVPISLTLVQKKRLSIGDLIKKMTIAPARILGLQSGIVIGNIADLTVIDLESSYTIKADSFHSLSRNTPFDGWTVTGKVVLTMVGGKVVYDELNLKTLATQ